jgi:hypothetical protein
MCQACVDTLNRLFPDLSESDKFNILMGATGFPIISVDATLQQLREFAGWRDQYGLDGAWGRYDAVFDAEYLEATFAIRQADLVGGTAQMDWRGFLRWYPEGLEQPNWEA